MRTEIKINKIVNFDKEEKQIKMLDDFFIYEEEAKKPTIITMCGATGTIFEIVSKDYFDKIISPYENEPMELLRYYVENFGEVTTRMIDNIDEACTQEELKNLFFDLSYIEHWDYLREELNLNENEAYLFNCVGGGRCFNEGEEFSHNKDLKVYVDILENKKSTDAQIYEVLSELKETYKTNIN
jgi:hypothetical protein